MIEVMQIAHCWHVEKTQTDTFTGSGREDVRCCHCGNLALKKFTMVRPNGHGKYCEQTERSYQLDAPTFGCKGGGTSASRGDTSQTIPASENAVCNTVLRTGR